MFDIKVVKLMEALGRELKHEIGPVGGYRAVGDRV